MTNLTYKTFAETVIDLINAGAVNASENCLSALYEKAGDLLQQQISRAEYAKAHPAKKQPAKGAGAATKERAAAITAILTSTPQTAAELAAACGLEMSALQVSTACKFIPGVVLSKVIRTVTDTKGLQQQRQFTAYSLEG